MWICRFTNLIRKKMMLVFVLNAKPKLDLQIGLPKHFARPRFAKLVCQSILPDLDLPKQFAKFDLAFRFAKTVCQIDLAFRLQIGLPKHFARPRVAKMVCQSILPDLDLPKQFAKSIWHLDLQIGLPKHFAGRRFAKMVCQIDLAFRLGKLICQTILPDLD
jgi:hypothetical protein